MLTRFSQRLTSNARFFSEGVRKTQMEVTIRSPYKTFLANYSEFSRIVTRTNEATLVIQNQTPAAVYVLPPGFLTVRLNGEAKGTTGNLIHTGGWAVVHPDNSCTIDLFDAFEKSEVNSDTLLDHVLAPPSEDLTGKYIDKIRRKAQSSISGAL